MSLTVIVLVVVAAIALAAAAIYLGRGGANRRSERFNPAPADATRGTPEAREGASASIPPLDPKTVGILRSGREGDRLSEDDIARQKLGARGMPGEPAIAPDLKERETQMPKPLDPGHTA